MYEVVVISQRVSESSLRRVVHLQASEVPASHFNTGDFKSVIVWSSAGLQFTQASNRLTKITIDSLLSAEFVLKRPVNVVLDLVDGEIVATFPEAELSRSGEYAYEAIAWLKEAIVSTYKLFDSERSNLGPLPARQLAVLENYLGKSHTKA